MSELSQHAKLIKAIEIAKGAQVGIELSYFDVLEVAGELNEAKEVVAMLNARIAELEEAQRWIPVSERLPEEDTDGNTLMAICRHSGEWVRAPFGAEFADEFVRHYTHWMYAPQPPEVQE